MNRCYQYRLYPNRRQASDLDAMLWAYRRLYNSALAERKAAWEERGETLRYLDQANGLLKRMRADDEALAGFNYSAAQQVLRRLDKAFAAFFRRVKAGETPGYPRFKGRGRFNGAAFTFGDGASLRDGRLRIQGVGALKVKWHRALPDEAVVKRVSLKRRAGKWYVTFVLELPEVAAPAHPGSEVGIDIGLHALVTLSTGEQVAPPHSYRCAQAKLRRLQRRTARRNKASRRCRKAKAAVAALHAKVADQRRDFAHKLSRSLADRFALIAVEDLNIGGLARSRLAKSVHDAGWNQFLEMLSCKAASAGGTVVRVNPAFTSQDCSGCGARVPKPLAERVHRCPDCGLVLDRDHNAALNILARSKAGARPSGVNVTGLPVCVA